MISRRRLLVAASAVGASVLGGLGRPVAAADPAVRGAGHGPGHLPGAAVERFRYRGQDVEVATAGETVHVTIGPPPAGSPVRRRRSASLHVERTGQGRFATHVLPFTEYDAVVDLVRDTLDAEAAELVIL